MRAGTQDSPRPPQRSIDLDFRPDCLRFAIPAAIDPELIAPGVPVMTKWDYLPITYLPNVILGA